MNVLAGAIQTVNSLVGASTVGYDSRLMLPVSRVLDQSVVGKLNLVGHCLLKLGNSLKGPYQTGIMAT